jgi:hypothetical protein
MKLGHKRQLKAKRVPQRNYTVNPRKTCSLVSTLDFLTFQEFHGDVTDVAQETAICLNPRMNCFTGDRKT